MKTWKITPAATVAPRWGERLIDGGGGALLALAVIFGLAMIGRPEFGPERWIAPAVMALAAVPIMMGTAWARRRWPAQARRQRRRNSRSMFAL